MADQHCMICDRACAGQRCARCAAEIDRRVAQVLRAETVYTARTDGSQALAVRVSALDGGDVVVSITDPSGRISTSIGLRAHEAMRIGRLLAAMGAGEERIDEP
jgi:hypothetical protein